MKSVLILGATSDVARELAILFAKAKTHNIILSARNTDQILPLKTDLEIRFDSKVSLLQLDAAAFNDHGPKLQPFLNDIDVAICCWGYLGDQKLAEANWQETERTITANYTGCVSALNIIANAMEKTGTGCIIGVSSVAGLRGRQSNYTYGSAKAAFSAYLSGLRNRLFKSGVHVMTVIPGFMYTKMTEHLNLPAPVTVTAQKAAAIIYKAYGKKKNIIYVSFLWRYIMLIIRSIPEFIFKKLSL